MEYWQKLRNLFGKDTLILSGASGAIIRDGKILLVRNRDFGQWQTPGGLQEVGESIRACIQREIKEELDLDLTATTLISVYTEPKWTAAYPNGDQIQPLNFLFLMEGNLSTVAIQESEISAAKFFAPDEIPEDTLDFARQQVADWAEYSSEMFLR